MQSGDVADRCNPPCQQALRTGLHRPFHGSGVHFHASATNARQPTMEVLRVRHRLRKGQVEVRVRVDKGRQHAAVGGVHPLGARARIPD